MKWILFAMVMSPFNQPVDLVNPDLSKHQFDTRAECSELLKIKREEAIEMGQLRYLICDYVAIREVEEVHEYYKQDFKRRIQ